MRTHSLTPPCFPFFGGAAVSAATLAAAIALLGVHGAVRAEEPAAQPDAPSSIQVVDPFGPVDTETDPFELELSDTPIDADSYVPARTRWDAKQADFQGPAISAPQQDSAAALPQVSPAVPPQVSVAAPQSSAPTASDPCAAARFKPLRDIGIGIMQPAGESPTDFATPCWEQINAGPNGAFRCWPVLSYQWDATCLCYQPLYFEEINAERYGYICEDGWFCCGPGNCWQSAASAAHFFGTIPCLPYCLVAERPTECVYTLGHYRPGSCPPWRWHWPPWDPYAAAACAGVYTGLIFAIP
jgi:hypothetical protein